jgi:hypothetical protein
MAGLLVKRLGDGLVLARQRTLVKDVKSKNSKDQKSQKEHRQPNCWIADEHWF